MNPTTHHPHTLQRSDQLHQLVEQEGTEHFDAVIVGAGFGGLYALHKLRGLGLNVRVYERGDDVGGTWYWNRYPGLQCDIETQSYSFNFDQALFDGWTWSSRFAPQPEILDYARYVTATLDLRRDIEFETSVDAAHYDEATSRWNLALSGGGAATATYVIAAMGALSTINFPETRGLESFEGSVYHTGDWPSEPPDLAGRRVGIIGTGSSGVQMVCALGPIAGELTVFQRTPQYITPAGQRRLSAEEVQDWKDTLPELREQMRATAFCALGTTATKSIFDDDPEERLRVFEEAWDLGAQALTDATYNDIAIDEEANAIIADYVKAKIREIVTDPETAEKLIPTYLFKTRRPAIADGYYETFNRDSVKLVDINAAPIREITPEGIRTEDGVHHELDVIIFATGYDAITGALFNCDIRGRGGQTLKDAWENGVRVRSYLGVSTSGFPNMYVVQGPLSPGVAASYICGIEVSVDFIAGLIAYLREHDIPESDPDPVAESAWNDRVQEMVGGTLLQRTESWWTGTNVEGKPRPATYQTFVGGIALYSQILAEEARSGYAGFHTAPAQKEHSNA